MATRPRVVSPHAVPVVGRDEHLPPIAGEVLQAPVLRQRFARAEGWQAELAGDGPAAGLAKPLRPASVLVPLVQRPEGLQVLLTQRTAHLHDHAGQISFPGGRQEEGDPDEAATALRETEEEVGLARRHVEVIGTLPIYTTVTNYRVTPVVGLVQPPFDLQLDSFEVAEAFEVPLHFLMTPANHHRHRVDYDGGVHHFLSMPWHDGRREYFIWGATAAMLRNLYHFLHGTGPQG